MSLTDLLIAALIANVVQDALTAGYHSVPGVLLMVGVLVFWNYALNWLGFRFPRIQALVHPRPLTLVEDGRPIHRILKKELLTTEELMSLLRLQGVDDIRQVRRASMEGDGRISVLMAGENGAGTGRHQNERQPRI